MHYSEGVVDHELRQARLSKFGAVLAGVTLGYLGLLAFTSFYVGQVSVVQKGVPLVVATLAFALLSLVLRGAPRSARFIRSVELSTLFVGTAAISCMALVMDLTASPDMVVRSALT